MAKETKLAEKKPEIKKGYIEFSESDRKYPNIGELAKQTASLHETEESKESRRVVVSYGPHFLSSDNPVYLFKVESGSGTEDDCESMLESLVDTAKNLRISNTAKLYHADAGGRLVRPSEDPETAERMGRAYSMAHPSYSTKDGNPAAEPVQARGIMVYTAHVAEMLLDIFKENGYKIIMSGHCGKLNQEDQRK